MRPASLLVGAGLRRDAATRGALEFRLVAQHRIVDELGDLLERLGLVVVRVYVDNEEILVAALDRLLGGVAQQGARVEGLGGEIAEASRVLVHVGLPFLIVLRVRR